MIVLSSGISAIKSPVIFISIKWNTAVIIIIIIYYSCSVLSYTTIFFIQKKQIHRKKRKNHLISLQKKAVTLGIVLLKFYLSSCRLRWWSTDFSWNWTVFSFKNSKYTEKKYVQTLKPIIGMKRCWILDYF